LMGNVDELREKLESSDRSTALEKKIWSMNART
jgi:hypothetical protein